MLSFNTVIASGKALARRELGDNDTVLNLLMSLLGLAFLILVFTSLLLFVRRYKRQQMMLNETLPQYNDEKLSTSRQFTIQTGQGQPNIVVVNGRPMLADPHAPPSSPTNVPEIRITFPDEHDEHGQQKSGGVVIVRVGETTIGLEPVKEQLPAYEKESKTAFYSIDMDQIGGLKEKELQYR